MKSMYGKLFHFTRHPIGFNFVSTGFVMFGFLINGYNHETLSHTQIRPLDTNLWFNVWL